MESITENMKRNVNRIASGIDEVIINQLRQEMQEEKREREAMLQEMRRVKDDMSNSLKNAVAESKEDIDYSIGKMFETYHKRIEENMEHFEKTKGKSEPLPYSSGSEALEDAALTRQYRQADIYEKEHAQNAIDAYNKWKYEKEWQDNLEAYKRKKEEEAIQASYAEEDAYVKAHEPEVLAISAQKQARNDLEARTAKAQSKQSKDMDKALKQAEKEITPEKVSATVRKLDDLNDHIDNLMNVINGLSVQVAQLQNYVKTGQTAEEYIDGNGFILGASYNELYGKGGKS